MPNSYKILCIGTSAGGVTALRDLLAAIPATFPIPICVVLHVPRNGELNSEVLLEKSSLRAGLAEDKVPLEAGQVYFAPPDYHLEIDEDHCICLSNDDMVNFSRPSIDVLFLSAVRRYGEGVLGIIMTGANHDGAAGLQAVYNRGGGCWVQAPDEAEYPAMPQAALAKVPQAQIMSIQEMKEELANFIKAEEQKESRL